MAIFYNEMFYSGFEINRVMGKLYKIKKTNVGIFRASSASSGFHAATFTIES